MFNNEYQFDFSTKFLNAKLIRNVQDLVIRKTSIVINLDVKDIEILPEDPKAIKIIRKLSMWQSEIFKDVIVKRANAIIVIIDENLESPDTNNSNIADFPSIQLGSLKSSLIHNERTRKEIIDDKWEHVSKEFPFMKNVPLWKTEKSKIKYIDGFVFDPYYASGMTNEYDKSKEMAFKMRNYLWFTPRQTQCGVHNQHDFFEVHTQISGVGRLSKYSCQNNSSIYECQRMAPGTTQEQVFCAVKEENDKKKLEFIYPWHEYYSDTDCLWMVTEYWPTRNE